MGLFFRFVHICFLVIGGFILIYSPSGFSAQEQPPAQANEGEVLMDASESQRSSLVIDYPESTLSVSSLTSVEVVGSPAMTYCSLITKINLQRFTGLPVTTTFGEPQTILQGDAIRLIEGGLSTNTFVPVDDFSDIDTYFPERDAYTLFDLYIYTPHLDDEVSEKEYLFQGHRVVLMSVHDTWWVMDPLRGNTNARQSWDVYKQYLDPTAYLLVYHQSYVFAPGYVLNFSLQETLKSNRDVEDLPLLVYKGIIVSELDTAFMPLASTFLSNVTLLKDYVTMFFSAGTIIKTTDGSPFNVGLLTTVVYHHEKEEIIMKTTLSGKKLLFSHPVQVTFALDAAFPEHEGTRYVVKMAGAGHDGCEDVFDEKGEYVVDGHDNLLTFSICRTGDYSITPMLEDDLNE